MGRALWQGRRLGFEMKCGDAPTLTRSMAIAQHDLGLDRPFVIYPGDRSYPLADGVGVVAICDLPEVLARPMRW